MLLFVFSLVLFFGEVGLKLLVGVLFFGRGEGRGGGMRYFSVVSTLARDSRFFFLKKKGF